MNDEELSFKINVEKIEKSQGNRLSAPWLLQVVSGDINASPCPSPSVLSCASGSVIPSPQAGGGNEADNFIIEPDDCSVFEEYDDGSSSSSIGL
eukprot:TRINITY_DN8915_c0_g1_i1.p1 TRINITY_DN8915_c0_g1~~TRINITY_DN8915_c0_g1_i1.p1  ORF type:complete len:108 (+),score=15.08 TRINITY_DN8915_c0_g1_i1:45-326(+)